MSCSRRQFIQLSAGVALATSSMPYAAYAAAPMGDVPLPVPPLLESRRGQPLFLTLQRSHWSFSGNNNKVPVWGINGMYLGPTVRVYSGDDVKLIYSNRLNEPVAMTVSGLQVPGALMGGAPRMMSAGVDWAPVLPVRQGASTLWYHANTPNRMAPHVYNGLAGMWLIEDDVSKALPLPKHYGVDDFPLIIQDKRLDNFATPVYNPPSDGGFLGDTLLVNGVQNPYVEVSRGWVRLRLLNASNARRFDLSFSDNRPFTVIASDQGFLPAPVAVQTLSLAPGERREVLVDMSQGDEVSITAGTAAGLMDRLRGLFEPSSILANTLVLSLRPTGLLPLVTDNLPMRLLADQILDGVAVRTREFRIGDSVPGINGALWDMSRIDTTVQQGTFERWIIHADRPQSLHIQGVMFLIKSVNGAQPMGEDRGWKDTVWVDGDVELLVSFPQSSSDHFPFVYYSQTLELADRGTAGQLQVNPVP
ncbi:cell division protein FtsP [Pantoea sp. JGM49]|jgi:suppressor of ftsI|uniref:cell division protein FtsP n=2 Tax=Gammaproteobacteria TaxID=1236 RepID=UPI000537565F|nr:MULTISPECIES: cell division protein FtsP [Enterobacterales]MDF7628143.1 cell division protein FtsP [Erwiniaceae bacterium L1_55_4]MDI6935586.1 cell division protein FtsP [Serratia sp. Se-PFBMAAmG]KGT88652.1 cell division protein FtsI [Enterobacter cancerogenus]MBS0881175.1 cell division protein FtsP [Pantoea sp. JGM49]MDI9276706.1 cell division protein FtsP [Pantoea sp. EABMAA-21]